MVGDALGVPVEFRTREEVHTNPVTDMRGHGTHNQPAGTWSDDSSLLLCTTDSLSRHEFDTEDMGKRFVAWYQEKLWTPWGRVFDVGMTTARALGLIANGIRAEVAGGDGESSNGNGSLMRILPVVLRFSDFPTKQLIDRVHRASAITHRHPRSQSACGLHSLVVRELLNGALPSEALKAGLNAFRAIYGPDPNWAVELDHFQLMLSGDLAKRHESDIHSSGYVLHTLAASLWCLVTTVGFEECVLKAVNLGGDTDTTGCVAGGLAGVAYGVQQNPERWRCALARARDIEKLFTIFAGVCSTSS
jgi:ADP-ribosylglycohydrolase